MGFLKHRLIKQVLSTDPCFTNSRFIYPYFINPCVTNPVLLLLIQSNPIQCNPGLPETWERTFTNKQTRRIMTIVHTSLLAEEVMLSDQALTILAAVFVLFGVMGCMMLAIILKCLINLESAVSYKKATRNPAQEGPPHRREPKEDDDYGPDNIRGILYRSVENFDKSC